MGQEPVIALGIGEVGPHCGRCGVPYRQAGGTHTAVSWRPRCECWRNALANDALNVRTPVLPVVSPDALSVYYKQSAYTDVQDGLRAAFKVILRENLIRLADAGPTPEYWSHTAAHGIYRSLTGEEWPVERGSV